MGFNFKIVGDRLYLSCLCDGTLWFLQCMYRLLVENGFTDIGYSDEYLEDGDPRIPKDKPWCRSRFECYGVFPEGREQCDVMRDLGVNE